MKPPSRWTQPRNEVHRYLRRLVAAGYGTRVMFGSDQMTYPDALRIAIENVESADCLTPAEKRDILYKNAARFLGLAEAGSRLTPPARMLPPGPVVR